MFFCSMNAEQLPENNTKSSFNMKPEWFSLNFVGGNYGFGGGLSFVTLRLKYFYWEIAKGQFTIIEGKNVSAFSANAKTMFGASFYLTEDKKHDLRLGTGFSAGFSQYDELCRSKDYREDDYLRLEPGCGKYVGSIINIPIELSYIYNVTERFGLQLGAVIDIPLFTIWNDYLPLVNLFLGFRISGKERTVLR